MDPDPQQVDNGPDAPDRGAAACSPRWKVPIGCRASCVGRVMCRQARLAMNWCIRSICSRPWCWQEEPRSASWPSYRRHEDMRDFLLGDASASGRDTILCIQGNRLQAVKWRQWKLHLFQQDEMMSKWTPYNMPHLHNLEWDPREEHEVGFPHAWAAHPMAAAAGAFLKTLAVEPPIKPGRLIPIFRPSRARCGSRNTSRSA